MNEQEFNQVFAKRLRYYLDKYEMTQVDLAKRLGVGTTSVYNWLNAIKTPRMDKVDAMCQLFHCHRSDLIEDRKKIPLYGRVAAGEPLEMIPDVRYIDYEFEQNTDEYFAIELHGDSMAPYILDGDTAIVHKQDTANSGDLVIATVNGDSATCKYLRILTNGIELIPNNPSYGALPFTAEEIERMPVRIIGRVVQVRRDY